MKVMLIDLNLFNVMFCVALKFERPCWHDRVEEIFWNSESFFFPLQIKDRKCFSSTSLTADLQEEPYIQNLLMFHGRTL